MSKSNPKNLHYDDTLPPFLQRLRASNNNLDGRHEYTVSRAKKPRTEEDMAEDEPVYFNEESGETLSKGEWEAREAEREKFNGETDTAGEHGEKVLDGEEGKEREEARKEKVAEIGTGRKRKTGKIVGGGEEDVDVDSAAAIQERNGTKLGKVIATTTNNTKNGKQEANKEEKIKATGDITMSSQNTNIPFKCLGSQNTGISYVDRSAVRAILYNPLNRQIALVYIAKGNYYKLPGGGVEADEDHILAIAREVFEETGCKVNLENDKCFAKSEEWRNDLHQVSFCYVTRLVEDTGKPELTELEASEGLSHCWFSIDEAINTMRNAQPTSELGHYIKERDLFFVEKFAAAKDGKQEVNKGEKIKATGKKGKKVKLSFDDD